MSSAPASDSRRPLQLRLLSLAHRFAHRITGGRVGSLEAGAHAPRGATLKVITRVHRGLYRWTGGIIGGTAGGLATLLLTTTGRKTGQSRTVPLPYFPCGDGWAVVASYAGNPKNPAWYENLVANPDVTLQVGFRKVRARATTASEEETRALWPVIIAAAPMYADYQRITERTIPIVVLKPSGSPASG